LNWINGFLNNTTHQTRVGLSLSDTANLVSRVVQRSVIGPKLFLLFINDVVDLFTDNRCACNSPKFFFCDPKHRHFLECIVVELKAIKYGNNTGSVHTCFKREPLVPFYYKRSNISQLGYPSASVPLLEVYGGLPSP
jgi:hypothetical protein